MLFIRGFIKGFKIVTKVAFCNSLCYILTKLNITACLQVVPR
jgi:hypothetical protein